ncbi:MAG: hypothetical protein KGY54_11165 [Oleiphilaceae bacterium]|nr:hypothetical protein [Oleiphilaceae bacterium]
MASEWYTLVSQKLFLCETLLKKRAEQPAGPEAEAVLQGSIELGLRAQHSLLTLIARYYQEKSAEPDSLATLRDLIGEEAPEARRLAELERTPGSWWHHLDQLGYGQSHPPKKKKTVSDENIIAIGVEAGPDRSTSALLHTLAAMKEFLEDLAEWHDEW